MESQLQAMPILAKIEPEQDVRLTREEALQIYAGAIQQLRVVCPLLGLPVPLTGKERRRREQELDS